MKQGGFATILVLLVVVLVSGVGVGWYLSNTGVIPKFSSPATTEQPPAPPPAPGGDETANWKTYSNPASTFSFRYPPEMTVAITDLGLIMVEPENLSTKKSNLPTVTDDLGDNRVIIFYYGSLNGEALKDLVIKKYNEDKSGAGDKEVSSILFNGMRGYGYEIGGFRQDREIYLQDKTTNYIFIGTSTSPDVIAEKILSTFRFLD